MELVARVKVARIACAAGEFTAVVGDGRVRCVGTADDALVLATLAGEVAAGGAELAFEQVRFLPPVGAPPSVRDFYAFEQHVATARRARGLEMEPAWYEAPAFYFTNPAALLGHDAMLTPPARSAELDFELELALVVGRGGRDLRSLDGHVAGYTVLNDWSARDLQRAEMRVGLGPAKGKDFATSLGPWIVTPDELGSTMTAVVNGREISRGSADDLWWSFEEMACYASESADLRPGDVLGSGTVGTGCLLELGAVAGREAYPWLVTGDVVTLAVEGIGALTNTVGTPAPSSWTPRVRR